MAIIWTMDNGIELRSPSNQSETLEIKRAGESEWTRREKLPGMAAKYIEAYCNVYHVTVVGIQIEADESEEVNP